MHMFDKVKILMTDKLFSLAHNITVHQIFNITRNAHVTQNRHHQ